METGQSKNESMVDVFGELSGIRKPERQRRGWPMAVVFLLLITNICALLAYIHQVERSRRQVRALENLEKVAEMYRTEPQRMNEPSAPADVWMPEVMAGDQGAVVSSPTPLIVADQPGVETTEAPESNLPPQQQIENLKARLQAAEGQVAYLDMQKTRLEYVQMTQDRMLRESRWQLLNSTRTPTSTTAKFAEQHAPDIHGIMMVPIPPGTLMMGSEDGDPDEKPMHLVELTWPFWIGAHEVRIASILAWLNSPGVIVERDWICLEMDSTEPPIKWNGEAYVLNPQSRYGQSENQPMVYISQKGARAFCDWLTIHAKNGYQYRLPTEAEWEYAARAGSTTRYPLRDVLDQFATNCSHGPDITEDCGRYCPNAWGLYDTVGNASEWCADWYDENYYSSSPERNPKGPPAGTEVVVRSGNWRASDFGVRSADRNHFRPDALLRVVGFRVVAERK